MYRQNRKFDPRHPQIPQPIVTKICTGYQVRGSLPTSQISSRSNKRFRFCACVISRPSWPKSTWIFWRVLENIYHQTAEPISTHNILNDAVSGKTPNHNLTLRPFIFLKPLFFGSDRFRQDLEIYFRSKTALTL